MEGSVKFFNQVKGFGFVTGDDNKDYFIHISQLPEGITMLNKDERISFTPVETEKGSQAHAVELLQ